MKKNKKTSLIILFFVFITQLNGQENTLHHYIFGTGIELHNNSTNEMIYSPYFQVCPYHFIISAGPSFPLSLTNYTRYNRIGCHLALDYVLQLIKIKNMSEYFRLEFNEIMFRFDSIAYDYAVPRTPIKATIVHDQEYRDFTVNFGLSYRFCKRFYINANAGMRFLWTKFDEINDGKIYKIQPEYSIWDRIFHYRFHYGLETGVYF